MTNRGSPSTMRRRAPERSRHRESAGRLVGGGRMNGKSENHSCCAANASRALAPQTFRRVPRCRLVGLEEVAQTPIGRHRIRGRPASPSRAIAARGRWSPGRDARRRACGRSHLCTLHRRSARRACLRSAGRQERFGLFSETLIIRARAIDLGGVDTDEAYAFYAPSSLHSDGVPIGHPLDDFTP